MSIPGSASPLFIGAAAGAAAAGFQIDRSLRFNSADSAYLSRTPSSAGNRKTWTWSGWLKRTGTGNHCIFSAQGSSNGTLITFYSSTQKFAIVPYAGQAGATFQSNDLHRDPSAWYHFVIAFDSTQSTASDRLKVYKNGVEMTWSSSTYPSQNEEWNINRALPHNIGRSTFGDSYVDGYLTEIYFIDGQALAATDFGEYDSDNNWNPKEFSGTYGWFDNSQTWSSSTFFNNNGHGFYAGSAANLFDNVESGPGSTGDFPLPVNGGTFTLTFSQFSSAQTVELEVEGTGNALKINGSFVTIPSGSPATATYSVSGLTTIEWLYSGSNYCYLGSIKVDGKKLIDSSVSVADNSFYLKFADNSSNAALGTDSSGNSNTFTVNNLTAFSNNWPSYVYAGGATYSATATGKNFYTGSGADLFDGTTNNYVGGENVIGGTLYFRPQTAITGVTSIELYGAYNGETRINGSLVTVSPSWSSSDQYVSVQSPPSSITEISVKGDVGSGSAARLKAIKVNGSMLTDSPVEDVDSLIDTPTNYTASPNNGGNYATLNPLITAATTTLSNGNLDMNGYTAYSSLYGTIGISSGKYYWETTFPDTGSMTGIAATPNGSQYPGQVSDSYAVDNANKYNNNSSSSFHSFGAGSVVGCAFDADNGTLTFYDDGASAGTAFSSIPAGTYFPVFRNGSSTNISVNFGQRAFSYPPGSSGGPSSDFKSLCTTNLPDPTIADGSTAFDTKLWTGDGTNNRKISTPFSPDFVWVKDRGNAYNHRLFDTVRGDDKGLVSNSTAAEGTVSLGMESDGFVVEGSSSYNDNADSYVGWAWDAGTSTVSNTDGSITSNVRASQANGISIVTFTDPGSACTVGHGLNAAPHMIWAKFRGASGNWSVYHKAIGNNHRLKLNLTDAKQSGNDWWNATSPTNSVFSLGSNLVTSTTQVAYCFAPVEGFSAIGSYVGNGSTDGPFVYTGFRPAWILYKRSNASGNDWTILDSTRGPNNVIDKYLQASNNGAEVGYTMFDFLSNGFKPRLTSAGHNASGGTYVYLAFAEHPFKTARAR